MELKRIQCVQLIGAECKAETFAAWASSFFKNSISFEEFGQLKTNQFLSNIPHQLV